jgi:hypothetical protein
MPITQERYLATIEAADGLVQILATIKRILGNNETLLLEANSVIANTPDAVARENTRNLIGTITQIRDQIFRIDDTYNDMRHIIRTEKTHFAKFRNLNERKRLQQSYKRQILRDYVEPLLADPPSANVSLEVQRAIARNIEQVEREREAEAAAEARHEERRKAEAEAKAAEASLPHTQPEPASPRIQTHAGLSYDPEVISTSIPSLEELNKPDFDHGGDLL